MTEDTPQKEYWFARDGNRWWSRYHYSPVHWKGFVALFCAIMGGIWLLVGGGLLIVLGGLQAPTFLLKVLCVLTGIVLVALAIKLSLCTARTLKMWLPSGSGVVSHECGVLADIQEPPSIPISVERMLCNGAGVTLNTMFVLPLTYAPAAGAVMVTTGRSLGPPEPLSMSTFNTSLFSRPAVSWCRPAEPYGTELSPPRLPASTPSLQRTSRSRSAPREEAVDTTSG